VRPVWRIAHCESPDEQLQLERSWLLFVFLIGHSSSSSDAHEEEEEDEREEKRKVTTFLLLSVSLRYDALAQYQKEEEEEEEEAAEFCRTRKTRSYRQADKSRHFPYRLRTSSLLSSPLLCPIRANTCTAKGGRRRHCMSSSSSLFFFTFFFVTTLPNSENNPCGIIIFLVVVRHLNENSAFSWNIF